MSGVRRAGLRVLLAASACSLLLAHGAVTPVAAAWTDVEHVVAPVRVASSDCTEVGLYTASAASALLAGTVQGARIGSTSATAGVSIGPRADAGTATGTLRTADAGASPIVSGAALPLVLTSGGSWTQTASTSGTGASASSISGSSAFGAVDASGLLARSPSAASLLPDLSDVALVVGVPTASAGLDGCAAGWGAADALRRSSTLSTLTLRLHDTATTRALELMRSDATSAAAALTTSAGAATTPVGQAAASSLAAALAKVLTAGTAGPASGSAQVVPTTAPIAASIRTVRTAGRASVACDAADGGAIAVDLLPEPGDATGTDAELVTAGRTSAAASRVTAALQQQAAVTADANAAARSGTPVRVDATAQVLSALGVPVARVDLTASGTAGAFTSAVDAERPRPQVVVTVLRGDLLTLQSGLVAALTAELGTLPSVRAAVADQYLAPALRAAPDTVWAGRAADAAPLTAAHLAALPGVLTATAGQQATDAASSWTGSLASGVATRTALRVRIRDASGVRGDVFIGSVAVGPDRPRS